MSSAKKNKPPSNIHNDYALDQLETEEDCRSLIALYDPQEASQLGKITTLPTSYSDSKQRERRPDKVIKAKVLDNKSKVIGERIYLFEFKSEIRKTLLLFQILTYLAILGARYHLPVVPIIVYTGKRRLQQNGRINFREHLRSKNPAVNENVLDFPILLLNVFALTVALLQERAQHLAPGLYLAPRIFDINEEVINTFFHLCAELPEKEREQQLEKGCIFIVKYASEFDWEHLIKIEQKIFPERERIVGRVRFSREAAVEESWAEGEAKGKAEGEAKGKAEGLAEGEAKGKGKASRDIALRMLKEGEPEAKISRITGLSKKELQLLKHGARKQ